MITVCFGILMDLLKDRKLNAQYIAEKYEISTRTVYRYIDVLSANNIPIFCTRGRNGGIQIADNYRLPASLLTTTEQENVFTALNLLKGALPDKNIDDIKNKFLAVNTSGEINDLILSADKYILEGTIGDSKLYIQKIEPLTRAVDNNLITQIVYRDRGGKTTTRNIRPHTFVLKDMVWYIYAYCELRKDFRMFKISRIEKISVKDKTFKRTPRAKYPKWKFDFEEEAEKIDLLLYVDKDARYDVEEWLGVECVKPQSNDNYAYIASCEILNDMKLMPRLMSFGSHIKVISPKSLKNQLTKNARQLLECYTNK